MRIAAVSTLLVTILIPQVATAQVFPGSPSKWYGEAKGIKVCLQMYDALVPVADRPEHQRKCASFFATLYSFGDVAPTEHGRRFLLRGSG